eukprot:TRINITY_DN22431_c0_g1_i1.p1 TRINITY_DN22431_c0_g1~~TRINITY_DN22431_c0_g1_i1.p1  ORF type:complete len:411 (-),score=42.07 TRINITY_DN22431_c0_g1_i1:7-1239(-)
MLGGRGFLVFLAMVSVVLGGGKLSLTVHYPDHLLKCPNSLILAVNELSGWDVLNVSSLSPIPSSIMEHIAADTWWIGIPYDTESFTKTIFSRYLLFNPCLLSKEQGHPTPYYGQQLSSSQEASICTFLLCRNVGKGDLIYLSESGLSSFDAYPFFYKSEGEIRLFPNFPAPQLPGGKRDINVYVPPSLLENTISRSVQVLYMFDGQLVPQILSLLNSFIITGSIKELVVVGIPATINRTYELTPSKCQAPPPGGCNGYDVLCPPGGSGGLPNTLAFIENNVHPFVLSNLSVSAAEVASAGWSLGGLAACESLYMSAIITKAYCASPSLWWNCNEFIRTRTTRPLGAVAFLDGGFGEASIWQPAKTVYEHLGRIDGFAKGGNLWYNAAYGDFHEMASWLNRLPNVFQTLFA